MAIRIIDLIKPIRKKMFEFDLCLFNPRKYTVFKNLSGFIEYRITHSFRSKYRMLLKLRNVLNDNSISDIHGPINQNEYFIIRNPGRVGVIQLVNTLQSLCLNPNLIIQTATSYNNDKEIILKLLAVPCLTNISMAFDIFNVLSVDLKEDIEINIKMLNIDKFRNRRYKDLSPKLRNSKRIVELFIHLDRSNISDFCNASLRLRDNKYLCFRVIKCGFLEIHKLSPRLRKNRDIIKFTIMKNNTKLDPYIFFNILDQDTELRQDIVIFALRFDDAYISLIARHVFDEADDKLIAAVLSINFEWYRYIYVLSSDEKTFDGDVDCVLRIISLMKISNTIAKQMFKLMGSYYTNNVDIVAVIISKNKKAFKYIPHSSYLRRNRRIIALMNSL